MIKDIKTGKIRVTGKFREEHGKAFGQAGYNLRNPFSSEKALLQASIDTLDDDACDALANAMGLLPDNEKTG